MPLIQNGSPCFSCLPSLPSLDWEPTFIFLRVSSSVYVYILKRKNLTNHIGMFYALHAPPCPPMSSHSHIWVFPSVLSKTYSVLFTIRFCFLATYFFFHTLLEKSPLMLSLLTQLVVPVMASKWILVLCFQKCF